VTYDDGPLDRILPKPSSAQDGRISRNSIFSGRGGKPKVQLGVKRIACCGDFRHKPFSLDLRPGFSYIQLTSITGREQSNASSTK